MVCLLQWILGRDPDTKKISMSTPRLYIVEDLVQLALDGLAEGDPDATTSELLSAVLTLANRVIGIIMEAGGDPRDVRPGVETLLMHCVSPKKERMS